MEHSPLFGATPELGLPSTFGEVLTPHLVNAAIVVGGVALAIGGLRWLYRKTIGA